MKTRAIMRSTGAVALAVLAVAALGTVLMPATDAPATDAGARDAAVAPSGGATFGVADVVEDVAPSVVNISTERTAGRISPGPGFDEQLERFFFRWPGQRSDRRPVQSQGSGVIYSADGLVLTNHHVVRDAESIRVGLYDGREVDAELVGSDESSDLALLRVDADDLRPVRWADSRSVRVGDPVLAMGNPFGLGETVTRGIVSAKGRSLGMMDYEDFLQTDAIIHPGNSGGPLVDLEGQVVGINTAILSRNGAGQGIGFAIPSYLVETVATSLRDHGRVVRGYLGIYLQELTSELARASRVDVSRGVIVSRVIDDSPADDAGLQHGDVIVALDGAEVTNGGSFRAAIGHRAPGSEIELAVIREGEERDLVVVLGERPANASAAATGAPHPAAELGGFEVEDIDRRTAQRMGLDPGTSGPVVTRVQPSSSAARAGLRRGDRVLEVGRERVASAAEVRDAIRDAWSEDPTAPVLLLVERDGATLYLALGPVDG
ncbi:MAG TPA: Do family serine endopeptidase [Candidatus Krumholzibacteria bacterium]|nr:Do family serine endopeptidase [Candidatus Krumholzibacteria bacterium]